MKALENAIANRIIKLPSEFDAIQLSREIATWETREGTSKTIAHNTNDFLSSLISVIGRENLEVKELQKFAFHSYVASEELGVRHIRLSEPEKQFSDSWVSGALNLPSLTDSWDTSCIRKLLLLAGINPSYPKYGKVVAYLLNQMIPAHGKEVDYSEPFNPKITLHTKLFSLPKKELPSYKEALEFLDSILVG